MTILGIETSCDETAVGVITVDDKTKKITLRSNIVATSLALHAIIGGIIPEIAAREQLKYMLPVLQEALLTGLEFDLTKTKDVPPVDAIAVTYGPGLIGSLLVGVETAKTLSMVWNKPLIPVNHMYGHIYANWIEPEREIALPALCLVVSGGHTDLVLIGEDHTISLLGGTRDDAAGEAFDKIARLLGFPYPGGPVIEKRAKEGNPKAYAFPRPLLGEKTYDFSFSGLKTAVLREVRRHEMLSGQEKNDIAASVQEAIIATLVKKTLRTIATMPIKTLLLSGGVAANSTLIKRFEDEIEKQHLVIQFHVPPKNLCTDNGAMIAAAAAFHHIPVPWQDVTTNPELYY